jgi:opacity protein-like surface antigen
VVRHFLTKKKKMTKLFLTAVLSLFTIISSAQMMVTSSLSSPEEGADWAIEDLTDNLGLGYTMDKFTVGVMMNGDNYDLFGRYSLNDNLYVSGLMTEDDEMSLGLGYSLKVWDKLYIEPSYMYNMSDDAEMCDDEGMGKMAEEDKGELKLSLTYKF